MPNNADFLCHVVPIHFHDTRDLSKTLILNGMLFDLFFGWTHQFHDLDQRPGQISGHQTHDKDWACPLDHDQFYSKANT